MPWMTWGQSTPLLEYLHISIEWDMSRIKNPQEGIYRGIQLISDQGYHMGDWEVIQIGEGWAALNIDIDTNLVDHLLEEGHVEFRSEEDDVVVRIDWPTGGFDPDDEEMALQDQWYEELSNLEDDYMNESILRESDFEARKREREMMAFGGAQRKVANMRDRMRAGEPAVPCQGCEASGEVPEYPVSFSYGMESPIIECSECDGYGYKNEEQILKNIETNQDNIDKNEQYLDSMNEYFGGAASWDLQYHLVMQSYQGNAKRYREKRKQLQNELHQVRQMGRENGPH